MKQVKPRFKLHLDGRLSLLSQTSSPETVEQKALDGLRRSGVSIAEWSRAHGFSTETVKAVLYGHNKGRRGQGHRVAIALGLKSGYVVASPQNLMPVRSARGKQ
ncbi:MAG: hypothetical protein AB7P37_21195 [Ramlibacter sp.]